MARFLKAAVVAFIAISLVSVAFADVGPNSAQIYPSDNYYGGYYGSRGYYPQYYEHQYPQYYEGYGGRQYYHSSRANLENQYGGGGYGGSAQQQQQQQQQAAYGGYGGDGGQQQQQQQQQAAYGGYGGYGGQQQQQQQQQAAMYGGRGGVGYYRTPMLVAPKAVDSSGAIVDESQQQQMSSSSGGGVTFVTGSSSGTGQPTTVYEYYVPAGSHNGFFIPAGATVVPIQGMAQQAASVAHEAAPEKANETEKKPDGN